MKVKEDGEDLEAKGQQEEARDEQARKEWIKKELEAKEQFFITLIVSRFIEERTRPEDVQERVKKLIEQAGGKEYDPQAIEKQAYKELSEEARTLQELLLNDAFKYNLDIVKNDDNAPKQKELQRAKAFKEVVLFYANKIEEEDGRPPFWYDEIITFLDRILEDKDQEEAGAPETKETEQKDKKPLTIYHKLKLTATGKFAETAENFDLIMNEDKRINKNIYLDVFTGYRMTTLSETWKGYNKNKEGDKEPRLWTDADDKYLLGYIETTYGLKNRTKILDALDRFLVKKKVHPIKDFILSESWDGEKRIKYLLPDFLGTEANNYTEAAITDQLVAAVGRVFSPGIKWDLAVVFYGGQGIGKSSFIRALACDKWVNESITTMEDTKGMEQLQGSWLVELSELSAMKKSEVEQIKNYLSKQVDRYRPAYGRYITEQPRQCVFFGTTNEKEILKDNDNRRFIVVECGINEATRDIHGLIPSRIKYEDDRSKAKKYVQQIWAEAYHIFEKQGFILKQSKYTKGDYLEEQQAKFIEVSEYYEPLEEYILTPVPLDFDEYDDARKRVYYQSLNDFNRGIPNSAISELVDCAPCGYLNAGTYVLPEDLRYLTRVSISEFMKCFLCIEDKDKDRRRISIAIGKALRQINKLSTDIRVSKEIKNMRCEDGLTRKAVEVYRIAEQIPKIGGNEDIEDVEDYDYNLKQKGLI